MINSSVISSISLSFNDSWMAHLGSRMYRIAIEALEGLFGDTFFPNEIHSGGRLYRLVDTYSQSNRDGTSYDRARFYYAGGIITALQGEKDVLKKTRKAKAILKTQIMGLTILQKKDKKALSQHISYTLLPTLIDELGRKIANKAILALNELDTMVASGNQNLHKYVTLYQDISLQQWEFDRFVRALEELDSGISKDILINELLLSRNRNLSKSAKDKMAEILQSEHYIDRKLQKKLQLVDLARNLNSVTYFDKAAQIAALHENRNNQLEALCHKGPSMFFASDEMDNISLSESEEEFFDALDLETDAKSISDTPSIREPLLPPIGISNTQLNCWYNSTLQILRNTPIYLDMVKHKNKFATDFPTIFASFNLYQRVFVNQIMYPQSLSKSEIVNIDFYLSNIRKEAHHNLDKEFKEVGVSQEDSEHFLYSLLEKLSIPVAYQIWQPGEEIPSVEETHLFLEKSAPSQLVDNPNIALIKIDLQTLFAATDHQLYGVIFHTGADYSRGRDFNSGHYFAAVKKNESWYLCDDSRITKISETEVETLIQKNKALLIASRPQD